MTGRVTRQSWATRSCSWRRPAPVSRIECRNIRIIDGKTGRILNATTVDGSAMTAGVGLTANVSSAPLPLGLGGWSKTPMERAIRNCIDSAVQHIVKTNL